MAYEFITFDIRANVAESVLNRPDRLNAITPRMLAEIGAALDGAVAQGARAILMTGAGRAFCSGADIIGGDESLPEDLGDLLATHYNPLVRKFAALPVPVVTAVNGLAAGAGCSLALLGDFVLAARPAYFLLAFVNIGLVPDVGATWLVAKAVGRARALEMMLLGERIPAHQAESWGLIHKALDEAVLLDEARALAVRLANGPTQAIAMMRQAVTAALSSDLDAALDLEAQHQRKAGRTADFAEGVCAFQEKRQARFTGG